MSSTRTKRPLRSAIGLFGIVVILGAAFLAALNYQTIYDHVLARQYVPTNDAVALRDTLQLTDTGSLYFNASQTELSDANAFNQQCPQREPNSPILGCYTARKIFVYDIRTADLEGIRETTAAHELLHAAYDRLSESQKTKINQLLEKTYERVKTPELEERMNYYKKNQPGEEINELHSILGTEQPTLNAELEQHYARYFKDRARIARFYQSYNTVFRSITNQISELQSDINQRVEAINQSIERYNSGSRELEQAIAAFNDRSNRGDFATQSDFLTVRSQLLAQQSQLTQERDAINQSIDEVSATRQKYDSLIARYNQLSESINSAISPTPQL